MNDVIKQEDNVVKIRPPKSGRIRLLIAGDIHFPFHDPIALDLLVELARYAKPDILVINGDLVDFHGTPSRFYRPPERRAGFKYEIYADRRLIRLLDAKISCPVKILTQGNHESRLEWALAQKQIELHGLDVLEIPTLLDLPKTWIYVARRKLPTSLERFVAAQVQIENGTVNLFIQHGDLIRVSGNTQHVAKCVFTRVLTNMIINHWHRNDIWVQTDYKGKAHGVWVNGCLSLPRPDWDAGKVWGQGATIVDVFPKGLFDITQVRFMKDNGALTALFDGEKLSVSARRRKSDMPPLEEIWLGGGLKRNKNTYTFESW